MTRNYPDMRKGGWRWLAIARRAIANRVAHMERVQADEPMDESLLGALMEARACLRQIDQVIAAAKKAKAKEASDG